MFTGYILAGLVLSGSFTGGECPQPSEPVVTAPAAQAPGRVVPSARKLPVRALAAIDLALSKSATCSFRNVPLQEALDTLHTISGVNFVLDADALRNAKIAAHMPVTITTENLSLRSTLDLLLRKANLTYVINDKVILVTTPEGARGRLRQVTYSVADLVVPVANAADLESDGKVQPQATLEDQLMRLISNTIAPDTWTNNGGPGTLQYFPLGMALVINQYQDVHEQIQELLCALRRLQDTEIAVEIRVARLSDLVLAKIHSQQPAASGDWNRGLVLDESQMRALLATVQASRRSSILQAPKITLFNGQTGALDFTQNQAFVSVDRVAAGEKGTLLSGWKYRLCPVVSADRRAVFMKLQLKRTDVENVLPASSPVIQAGTANAFSASTTRIELARTQTLSLEQSLSIPDGMTAVLYVGEAPGKRHATTGRREIQHYLVLITPRIIVNEREEEAPARPRQ
jgi:hypothetical protein